MAKKRAAPLDLSGAERSNEPAPFAASAAAPPATLPLSGPPERLRPVGEARGDSGALVWALAAVAALLWVAAVGGLALGAFRPEGLAGLAPFQQLALGLLALGPVALIFFCAALARESARLAAHNSHARGETARLLDPMLLAAAHAGGAVSQVREEIGGVQAAVDEARDAVRQLAEMIAGESRALQGASAQAGEAARNLAAAVAAERDQLGATSATLQDQAGAVAEAVARQARMVAEAAELAQSQIREAELALSARAADLAAAAGEATDAARAAGGDLSRQTLRLETAARDLNEQVRVMEGSLAAQRDGLTELGRSLAGEQDSFVTRAELHRLQLADALAHAREGAREIGEVSSASGQALQAMVASAAAQVHDLAEAVLIERERIEARGRESLGQIGDAASAERARIEEEARAAVETLSAAAEEASRAAELQARTARDRVEQLNEAAFDAGRQADEAFETRLTAARRVIDQSVALVDQAGARSGERIQVGLESARESLAALDRTLDEIDARVQAMPGATQARVAEVRRAVEEGVEALQDAARRAAAETQAIDAAFQERVRRNYEALSEAVRLMGLVAASPAAAPVPAYAAPQPTAAREPAPEPAGEPAITEPEPLVSAEAEPEPEIETAPEPPTAHDEAAEPAASGPTHDESEPELSAEDFGLRPAIQATEFHEDPAPEPAEASAPLETQALDDEPDREFETQAFEEEALFASARDDPEFSTGDPEPVRGEAADAALFEPEAGEEPLSDDWSWRDVLSADTEEPADLEGLADRLATELQNMSVDPERLLPRSRVEEIAAPVHAGDREGARAVTRRLAPAALRRLSRRLATDPVLQADARQFVRGYGALLRDASHKDRAGYMTATLLTSEAGRVWLLIDAADA